MGKTSPPPVALFAGYVLLMCAAAFADERIDTALLGDGGVAWTAPVDDSPAIHRVSGVGDVDGDGLDDFAVGFLERPYEETLTPSWALFLVYGRPRVSGDVALVPELERTWQVRGRAPTDRRSHQVFHIAPAGDVDGDGYGEFFLGYARYPDNEPGHGAAVLVHGGPELEGQTTLEDLLDSDRVAVFRSSDPRYQLVGRQCYSIGDFNGDGEVDMAISAPKSRLDTTQDEPVRWPLGAAFLLFSVRELPHDVDVARVGSTFPGIRIEGFERIWEETGDLRGLGLGGIAPLGDFNGDGLSDVALTSAGPRPERLFVLLGNRDSPSVLRLEDARTDPSVIEIRGPTGAVFNTSFGGSDQLAGLGDLNGDGLSDFGVSQSVWCCAFFAPAESWVQVFFGSPDFPQEVEFQELDSSLGVQLQAVQQGARFGDQIASAGDFDGDGRPDLLIGSPNADPEGPSVNDRGEAYVLFSRDGFAEPSTLRSSFPGVRVSGAGSREVLGYPVAPAGDFDGDGFDDVLLVTRYAISAAERREHPGQPRVYLIHGGPSVAPLTLTLADVAPPFGPTTGGETVRLVGSGFLPDVRVFFGDEEALVVEVHSSICDVVIPPGKRGLVDVSVTVGAERRTLESSFFYSPVLPLDLAEPGRRGFTIRGPTGLGLGKSIAVDDFDGDGFDDALLSACWTPDAELDGCSAVLVRGRRDPKNVTVPDPSESTTTFMFPDSFRSISMGSPGDVDADGIGDMFFAFDGGYGYLVFGRPGWPPNLDITELFEEGGVTEVVSPAIGRMPVARLGDVDGDGIDDFAVTVLPDPLAAVGVDPGGEIVFVAGRRSWENLLELPAQASGRIRAGLEANEFGWEIAPAGDVNGDGIGDLLANSFHGPEQSAYLVYGHPALFEGGAEDLSTLVADRERARSFVGISPAGGPHFLSLSEAGDVNGDGFSDILLGLPQAGGLFRGRPYLIFGASFLDSLVLEDGVGVPPGVTALLGDGATYGNAHVARCGDLDGDGLDDFAIHATTGVPPNPGYVYVLSGMDTFPSEIVLGRAGLESIRLDGTIAAGGVSEVAESVGDFNGDGADDFLVRERGHEGVADHPAAGDRISIVFGLTRDVLFVRGDTNADSTVNLADSVFLLFHLFAGGDQLVCMKAGDTNDDGGVDVADAIFLLTSLFAGGDALPEPNGVCGPDPTMDDLSCEAGRPCRP